MAQESVPLARVSSSAPAVCHPLPGSYLFMFMPVARSSPQNHGPEPRGTVESTQLPEDPEVARLFGPTPGHGAAKLTAHLDHGRRGSGARGLDGCDRAGRAPPTTNTLSCCSITDCSPVRGVLDTPSHTRDASHRRAVVKQQAPAMTPRGVVLEQIRHHETEPVP